MTEYVNIMHISGMDTREIIKAAGGCAKLASICGLRSHTTPLRWKLIPIKHAKTIETALGIPKHKMRPDVYDAPEAKSAA
ncbi:hypothetical protein ACE4RV_06250 [Acetobacter persici]|uniref:hypothetical protein n=1 Tax=Acetobacter persici TaxID=1076596 RepID=UPI0036DB0290